MITIVTGLGRCGSSMVMKMLHKGGMEVYPCDSASYETNMVFLLEEMQTAWLEDAEGKALKVLDPFRYVLPKTHSYKFILLTRNAKQQAKSMVKLLKATAPETGVNAKHTHLFLNSLNKDISRATKMLNRYPNSSVLNITFEEVILNPYDSSKKISDFLKPEQDYLDTYKMADQVIKRDTDCYDGFLEFSFM